MSAAWWWKRFSRGRGRWHFSLGWLVKTTKKSSCFTQMDVVCEDVAELSPRSDNIWFYTEGDTLPCKRFGNYISNYLLEGALETLAQLHQGWHWEKKIGQLQIDVVWIDEFESHRVIRHLQQGTFAISKLSFMVWWSWTKIHGPGLKDMRAAVQTTVLKRRKQYRLQRNKALCV